jgi:ribosomal protein L44E
MYSGNILPTSGPKEVDAITRANIQRQSQEREYEIVEDCIGNVKLKNYTSEDSALSKTPGLFQYYCSICGNHSLVTDSSLAGAQRRRTDLALIIDPSTKFLRYLKPGRKVALKRKAAVELQWRWECNQCGFEIAYQNCPFDEVFFNELTQKDSRPGKCFYLFKNALATETCYCEVIEAFNVREVA